MVICDGFNVPFQNQIISNSNTNGSLIEQNGIKPLAQPLSAPFPKPPPQPPARQFTLINSNGSQVNDTNGHTKTNGHHVNNNHNHNHNSEELTNNSIKKQHIPNKLPLVTSTSSCNYDNLRNIDSDESRLTSPEAVNNYLFNGNSTPSLTATPKMPTSQSYTNNINKTKPTTPLLGNSAQPITDKNIMNNIMNKCNNFDPKSQSMLTTTETHNSISVTPVKFQFFYFEFILPLKIILIYYVSNYLKKLQSDSVRSFKDKMQFFETCRENTINKRKLKKFISLKLNSIEFAKI